LTAAPEGEAEGVVVERLVKTFPISHDLATWLRHRGRPPRFRAVDDVGFRVRRGELFGLLGANGAGKSTILRVLAGLMTPDDGVVRVNGVDVRTSPLALRAQIGLCTAEERTFYYRLTARANLEFFGELAGLHGPALGRRMTEVCALVDLEDRLDCRFESFSSGTRQRLAIARALLGRPDVLLLDEPTRAVDPVHAAAIRRIIRRLVVEQRKTVVLCTNQLDEAWELCDRIAVLAAGRLVTVAEPADLVAAARRKRFAIDFDRTDDALVARARAVDGVRSLSQAPHAGGVRMRVELDEREATLTELLRAVSANGICVRSVEPENATPFEAFARVAGVPHAQ
jgi:ABC-2 type transport system ATP-binding protein